MNILKRKKSSTQIFIIYIYYIYVYIEHINNTKIIKSFQKFHQINCYQTYACQIIYTKSSQKIKRRNYKKKKVDEIMRNDNT
ncbi:hypothetical protein PFTANZ_03227 [Plasmodium falciparum Tanzania (2000708)]|uniref:Uncharacterized protein n=1 Tax=Plasmodium falciparum Tanzania (2000708) TaxID=1036725 RepID=A0A024W7B5_PLAFA|nr:hypothetical protein PFTANZ_03227 [Plasmodium falciparum Tanzania (2000708)]